MNNSPTYLRLLRRNGSAKQPSPFRLLPTSLKLRRTGLRDRITNFLCLSLLLLGTTVLGMNPSFASSLASRGQVNPERHLLDAARLGKLEEVERLIRDGASVEAKDGDGWTPLMYAALAGHEDVCKLLIENKALIEAKDNDGWTPLFFAVETGHEDVCKLFIANKVSVEAKDNDGWTPLIVAAKFGNEAVCRFLIANKALVGAKDNHGLTPLIYAASFDHEDVCRLLIDVQLEPILEIIVNDKVAIITLLGIAKKGQIKLPCYMPYDVAKIIARQAFEKVRQVKGSAIEQINKLDYQEKAKWLAYANEQMNAVNK